ncbi:putative ribonuclease H-like domain-containing protein [Tanacetum coccineum]
MSEAENHPPASSVTALRIPIIKKGEYDLWCMKMRQYIAITDHILWDIITNGDQATTEPASSLGQPSAPKTSIVVNARRNNESKKMQKNLLKQQFETFVVGAREELDSAYDRFQNIISMLELYDAKVSCEDANLKFLRSLPSVWHVVATMIRGQPGLDELDFDDLYNNLKVYEHELKGASSSNSQSIAFMSAEIKGSTSRQSTADDKSEIITKGYAQASSSKLKETLNSSFNSDEIICSFFAQQASMPETHDDEDLLQIDDDAMEEIDIRWQVAMITARIRKFMRKTGRPIDLKPKNGITFDKSKIECFNCQKLGHFARECKFAKYQANRANGSKEKRIVPIEDSNSKALVAKDSQGEIDWTKEFDDEPVTFAMVALNGIGEDDWSIEIDADHVDLGQDGLGVYDWSEEVDNAPVALALMATSSTDSSNSEVPYCSNCSKSYKKLLNDYQTERDNFQRARLEIQGYQLSLESLEVIIRTHEKNEYAWGDKYEQMEYDLKMRDWKLGEKQKELDNVIKERDELKEKLEKWSNATLLQTEILNKQKVLSDKTCIGFGVEYSSSEESNNSSGDETLTGPLYENFKREKAYKAVPPPTGTIIPPRADVAFTGIDELAIRNKVINKQNSESSGTDHESCESKNRDDLIKNKEQTQNTVKSNTDRNKVIIEDWVDSDDEEVPLGFSEIKKQNVLKSETSSENKSPRSKDSFGQRSRRRGLGYRDGKVCFVCYSPNHLIKDCDLHERKLKQTLKPKPLETQGSRDSRSVWNNTSRVNHRNFSSDFRHPHQRRSFIPSAVLTREGLKSTVRSKMSQAVPSQSTASTFYQNTARPNVSKAVLSQSTARPYFSRPVFSTSTGRPYYPRMDNVRPRASSFSPPKGFFNTRTVDRPKSPKPIIKSKWVKKESTAGTQAVLPQTKGEKGSVVTSPKQTWRSKGAYLDHRHKNNGSYTLKKFEAIQKFLQHKAHKALGKDEEGEDVDVHLYRSMIGCLMYLTASRPDIMFVVCLCARFQVTPKVSHMNAVKRIFRYLKHQPKLGLWYPKDSPFHLEAFSDSDYAGDNHDRRSTSGGCQYLGRRLVSWQCKKQTIVAISSTEAEYVAAASCCGQVLWMQNQLFDYGFNFMNTDIHIDNESTICIVKNLVFHSKTKHIQIRHHFIRDCYDQRLINVVKVHTDDNVADSLTKGFDLARFNSLVVNIGMMNP